MPLKKRFSFCCIALGTLSLNCATTPKFFHDKQAFDDSVHAFATLGKNVGEPSVKIGLPFWYLYNSDGKTCAQTPENFLAAFGTYVAYEEFKKLTGKQLTIPHIDTTKYANDPDKKKTAEMLNSCIDVAYKGIDLAAPFIIMWLLKTGCRQLD